MRMEMLHVLETKKHNHKTSFKNQVETQIVKQLPKDGTIFINYVKSKFNLAHRGTKPLVRKLIYDLQRGMRVEPI